MAVFIELTTDAFATTFNNQIANSGAGADNVVSRAGATHVRRPLRGLEIKDDTYAILKVVLADGSELQLKDSSSPTGQSTQFTNFILQSVNEARMEKHQIVETFGEPYIYFFGESPRFIDVTAVLVDSLDFNWYAEFWDNYQNFFRGTRLVELGARTYLFYDDNIVEGYMLMAQARKVSEQPLMAQLSFRLYITNYTNITFIGDPNFPSRTDVNIQPSADLSGADLTSNGYPVANRLSPAAVTASLALQAGIGASMQAGGFGGFGSLTSTLRAGLLMTGYPHVDGLLRQVYVSSLDSGYQQRDAPLRGLISDNDDEYTGPEPAQEPTENLAYVEVPDLWYSSIGQAALFGANINNPALMSRLGLGVYFTPQAVTGVGASYGVGTTYGGGLNGGLGFTGVLTTGTSASSSLIVGTAPSYYSPFSPYSVPGASYTSSVYGNGVPIQYGVIGGTGIGGGIPGGVSGGIGPNGPGTLGQFTGGQSYAARNKSSSQGYGSGLSGYGASINVGGAPTAFSLVSAPGAYSNVPVVEAGFFVGPDGVSSYTNTTGYFV